MSQPPLLMEDVVQAMVHVIRPVNVVVSMVTVVQLVITVVVDVKQNLVTVHPMSHQLQQLLKPPLPPKKQLQL